jgi:hypothetical protein
MFMHIHILCYPLRTEISKITNKYFLDDIDTSCFADIGGFDEHTCANEKKLIIPKGLSEYENRRRTDNIMVIKKPTK